MAVRSIWRLRPQLSRSAVAELTLYTRTGCGLCEEMLEAILTQTSIALPDIDLVDIDSRPELLALYANRIPVLEQSGIELAAGRLGPQVLHKLSTGLVTQS